MSQTSALAGQQDDVPSASGMHRHVHLRQLLFSQSSFGILTSSCAASGIAGSASGAPEASTLQDLLARKAELRRRLDELQKIAGRKIPKGPEPPRNKTHWDHVLEEMQWMAKGLYM